ncbi:hypothetical protein FRC06_001484 [Ceratobasidium sp. 370]|nr:hypothetical protein FRC06_001484 [Ceratobasidium sp. 370]
MAHVPPVSNLPAMSCPPRLLSDIISPCPNISVFYILRYHWLSGNTKSLRDRDHLCNDIILQPDFKSSDLRGVDLSSVDSQLAAAAKTWDPTCPPAEGWKNVPLQLPVLTPRAIKTCTPKSQPSITPDSDYVGISGFRARSLVDLMKKTFSSNDLDSFHYEPFEHRWKPPGTSGPAQTLSGEMYTSPVMIKAHREVQSLDIDCDLPRCIAGFMFASDASQQVKEQITKMHGKAPTDVLVTHLQRELMHAIWVALLDNEFVKAWRTGVVVDCADGIRCRVFPRILTYSADYPEKVLLATTSALQMGTPTNMQTYKKRRVDNDKRREKVKQAHQLIYNQGKAIQSKDVEDLLKAESYVPTMAIAEFNRRFRLVPTFGSVIRMFAEDVADMGRIAARDFEDILQCCGPIFKGLLPKDCDELAQTLLFLFTEWHGLAKLRLHTTSTLKIFKSVTAKLGTALRGFAKLTESMGVRETPKEYAHRKKQAEASKVSSMSWRPCTATNATHGKKAQLQQNPHGDGHHIRTLNLNTYKMHSFGDFPGSVEEFGTTDSYSMQIGELQNRKFKAQYMRTNKCDAVEQMTEIDDIMAALQDINKELEQWQKAQTLVPPIDSVAIDSLTNGSPYFIGLKERSEDLIPNILMWIASQAQDHAIKLKRHLLTQIQDVPASTSFTEAELAQLSVHRGRMYQHRTLRVNYTSYDVLRQQDTLNSKTPSCFVMLPTELEAQAEAHPFLYAKVLGVYHTNITYSSRPPKRMDFVHVQWLYYDYERPDAFDFVDPGNIMRVTHLIPDFNTNTTKSYLSQNASIAYDDKDFGDWMGYFVNRFVDCDMLMRYIGGGVGHYRQSNGRTAMDADQVQGVNDINKDGAGMGQEGLQAEEGANEDKVDNEEADKEAVANNRANDKEADDQAGDEVDEDEEDKDEADKDEADKDEADEDKGEDEEVDVDGDEDADEEEGLEGDYDEEDDEMGEDDDVDDELHGF